MNELPIEGKKAEIIEALANNQVIVVTGDTGCGKTTQLPLMLHAAGYSGRGQIVIAEPRRVGAISVATYVAQQLNSPLGELVGYKVRFDNTSVAGTAIKFVTNGILLQELKHNRKLSKYSVIVIDEAHERSIEGDLLISFLKEVLRQRHDLKVIIASATVDTDLFSKHFDGAPVITVPGRLYPVKIEYLQKDIHSASVMIDAIAQKVLEIDRSKMPGDILVFMPGRESIESVISSIWQLGQPKMVTLPLYSDLDPEEQARVFTHYPGLRKVIVATNIAETSITIDGIAFVIDCGIIKQASFDPVTGIDRLGVVPHAKAGCIQRSGRAGRTQPGTCYRMYSEASFEERPMYACPEIERQNLEPLVLAMSCMGITDVSTFDFLSKPPSKNFERAYERLTLYGALTVLRRQVTPVGRLMGSLPVEPLIGRMIAESSTFGCVREIVTIAAFLATPSSQVFVSPVGKEEEAGNKHGRFTNVRSDALTLLRVWNAYSDANYSRDWCSENFLNHRTLEDVRAIREQLLNLLLLLKVAISKTETDDTILRCLVSGMRFNLLKWSDSEGYCGVFQDVKHVWISPYSVLQIFTTRPRYIASLCLIETSQVNAHRNTVVEESWLREFLPHLVPPLPVIVREEPEQVSANGGGLHVNGSTVAVAEKAPAKQKINGSPAKPKEKPEASPETIALAADLAAGWQCVVRE